MIVLNRSDSVYSGFVHYRRAATHKYTTCVSSNTVATRVNVVLLLRTYNQYRACRAYYCCSCTYRT
jgi:hypothetical protein